MLNINFEYNSAVIEGKTSFAQINSVVKYLKEHPSVSIRLEGHTDCRGTREYNQKLSDARANAVADAISNLGISKTRIKPFGFGFDVPHAITAEDIKKNGSLRQQLVVGTVLTCDFVNNKLDKDLQEIAHALNRRTRMIILK
jgi:outer membrane protein OmpA-like peptidoglycan-associated protein